MLAELAAEFGIETRGQFTGGARLLDLRARMRRFGGEILPLDPLALIELGLLKRRIGVLSRGLDLDAPWSLPKARELDGRTVEAFKRRHCRTAAAKAVTDIAVRAVFTTEPSALSMSWFLFYGASGGGFDRLTASVGGAQQDVFVGGAFQIAQRMAEELGSLVRLDCIVHARSQSSEGVRVTTSRGTIDAQRVVVAVPPALSGRIF